MEELNVSFDISNLEEIQKLNGLLKFNFPVAYINSSIYFNSASEPLITGAAVRWFCSPDYIIGLPASPNSHNAFTVRGNGDSSNMTKVTSLPTIMAKEKKIQPGYYKLYKYKDGFAFKRNETLETAC